MAVVTSGAITITDVNDGISSRLSLENFLVVTDSAGANGIFTGAVTTMSVFIGSVDDSTNWTVAAAPSGGVTGSLAGKTYTVTALSTDTGYVDLTASRSGYPSITLRFSLSKAKQGATGAAGTNGTNGSPGADGIRGTIQTAAATTGSVWSDSEGDAAIVTAGGVAPIRGDVVTLFNISLGFSQTRVRTTGGAWAALAAFFGGDVLVNGTVVADKLATNSITSAKIAAGAVGAQNISIAESLTINAIDGGFSMGKSSAVDFANDGLYMGRTATALGSMGFGFLMGKLASGGVKQYIQHTTDNGLSVVNAQYGLLTDVSSSPANFTTSQTITLTAGVKNISMTILGGGGGGRSVANDQTAGGNTVVQLYNGTTYTGVSWTATGGLAGVSVSSNSGDGSVLGTGGANGSTSKTTNTSTAIPGANGTGFGAGGGEGSNVSGNAGGGKSNAVVVSNYDVSAIASPKLVITIGAGGTGGAGHPGGYSSTDPSAFFGLNTMAGNGSPGVLQLQQNASTVVPCGVVPLYPTAVGTFTKAANATGATVFPDLGVGLWVIAENSGAVMGLNSIEIDTLGTSLVLTSALSATFMANKRPVILTGNATARTIKYAFYKMKV